MGSRGRTRTSVPATPRSSFVIPALAVFASALLIRLIHLWLVRQAPFFGLLVGDARAYDDWAQRVAAGDWIGTEVFYQAPLYPYFLGAVYAIAGRHLWLVLTLQTVAGAAACTLVALAGQRLFSRQVGIVAGAMLALYAPAIFFDAVIQKASLDAFLIALSLYLMARSIDRPGDTLAWFGLGSTLGALSLTRENALVLLPVVGAWLWLERRLAPRQRWAMSLAFVAGVALLLVPVAARNASLGGGFYLTTSQFGTNLYIGNHRGSDGTYQPLRTGRGSAEFERQDATELAERAAGRALAPSEISSYWTAQAMNFVRSEPLVWAQLTGRKLLLLVNAVEIVDTESQQSYAEWSWPLRLSSWVGHFGVLFPLACLGAWARRRELTRAWVVPAMVFAYATSVVAFYVLARYRYPVVPVLVLLAAAGLIALPDILRRASRREQAGVVVGVAASALLANWPLLSPAKMHATSELNFGVALQAKGRPEEALEHYRRALALNSNDPTAYLNIGTLLHAAGRVAEAEALFARALDIQPGLGEAHYFLGKTLLETGRSADGIEHLRLALPAMPASTEVRTALGVALASQGSFDEATAIFRTVAEMSPRSAMARWNLGSALAAAGHFDEAIVELEESVRFDPGLRQARSDLAAVRQLRDEEPSGH